MLPWALDTPFWEHTANYSGGTPRIYTMEDPDGTVDAIVWAAIHPTKEYVVGWRARGAVLGDHGLERHQGRGAGWRCRAGGVGAHSRSTCQRPAV